MDASALDLIVKPLPDDESWSHEFYAQAEAELAALRARVEEVKQDADSARFHAQEARDRVTELEHAINWALGCGHADDPFHARKDGQGAYYWRPGLAARAAMRYDSHAERYVHDLAKHYEARRALRGET